MSKKEISKVEEPSEVYELTPKNDLVSEDLHPVLEQLIEKSKNNHALGNVFTHDEAMKIYKSKMSTK